MLPKMPLIASEPSIKPRSKVFLLMRRGPGGPGSVATRLLQHPHAHIIISISQRVHVLTVAVVLNDHTCIGYNIAVLTCSA